MRRAVGYMICGAWAYQQASIASAALAHFGVATALLMLFFCLLANQIAGAWWHGH